MKKRYVKRASVISESDLKTAKGKTLYSIFFILLVIVSIISVVPTVWTISTAFKETKEIFSQYSFFPKEMSWHRFVTRITESWDALQLGGSIINTCVLSLGKLIVNIVVCGFGGYVLSKLKPKGSKLIFSLIVWTMMMPSQIRMVPNYIAMLHFPFAGDYGMGVNLLDTYWPLWLGAGADCFGILLFKNSFDALSNSYVDAAKIDGCTDYGVFFKIMLPLSMPVIIYQSINVLSGAWSDFFGPLLYLDRIEVLPLKIYRLNGDSTIEMNTYFMALVIGSLPSFIIFALFQRKIMGGINVGGVKG